MSKRVDWDAIKRPGDFSHNQTYALLTILGVDRIKMILQGKVDLTRSFRDHRYLQAKVLWDRGLLPAGVVRNFAGYLDSIPEPPERPEGLPEEYKLILVDRRLVGASLMRDGGRLYVPDLVSLCEAFQVNMGEQQRQWYLHSSVARRFGFEGEAYWMWAQDGETEMNICSQLSRIDFDKVGDVGLSLLEGLCFYIQHPDVLDSHGMLLPGSVTKDGNRCPALMRNGGEVRLVSCPYDVAGGHYGSASRRLI